MSKILKKIDEFNHVHYVDRDNELGRGGQGVVYKTKNADTVIKIALENEIPIKDEKKIKAFHQKIKKLIYKPLPNDLNIAKPLVILQDEAGYVMQMLEGMRAFEELIPKTKNLEEAKLMAIPLFLKDYYKKDETEAMKISIYLNTGGLRKRLYALTRLAITLYRLHSRGIVYFDISGNNIFINSDDIPLVYLIDADNIEYESSKKHGVITPEFEVPEIMKGKSNSTYSDIYAFGILSFLTLTIVHPFDGKGLDKNDWSSEEKEKWELPWIEDSDDDSNRSKKSGLKGTLTTSKELYTLFHQLFEEGKNDKYKRPTLPIWIESLEKAACKTIKCLGCGMSYYDDLFDICPYCDAKKARRIVVKSYYYKNDKKLQERFQYVKEILDDTKKIEIPSYIFKSFDLLNIDDIFLEVKFPKKTRVELSFQKSNESIYFESKTPMVLFNKRVGIDRLEKGISIVIEGDITTLVEIKIEA